MIELPEKNVDETLSNREEENIECTKKKFQKKKRSSCQSGGGVTVMARARDKHGISPESC